MDETFYQSFLQRSIPEFANENIKAGYWKTSAALQKSEALFNNLLPDGVETEGHHLFQIVDEESHLNVGVIWFAEVENDDQRAAFLYDLYIDEPYRSHGYGKWAMQAIETKIEELGIRSISLHVFADNHIAKRLYQKLGYAVVKTHYDQDGQQEKSFQMLKELEVLS